MASSAQKPAGAIPFAPLQLMLQKATNTDRKEASGPTFAAWFCECLHKRVMFGTLRLFHLPDLCCNVAEPAECEKIGHSILVLLASLTTGC